MNKDTWYFVTKWLAFSLLLFGVHYYILFNFADTINLYFPIWSIYLFNSGVAFLVYFLVKRQFLKSPGKTYQTFLTLTIVKMVLAVVFLLPLFTGKSQYPKLETLNFFIPYFLFLAFEIFNLNKFFKNPETK